jgi:hypothetical protein
MGWALSLRPNSPPSWRRFGEAWWLILLGAPSDCQHWYR